MESSLEAIRIRYQELHSSFRTAFDLWLKGATIFLAILGVALGYIFQTRVGSAYVRMVCVCIIITGLLWLVCDIAALHMYKSMTDDIREAAETLGIQYRENNYRIFRVIMLAGIGVFLPIILLFGYLLVWPPMLPALAQVSR